MKKTETGVSTPIILITICLLLLFIAVAQVSAGVGGTTPVKQEKPRDISDFIGKYLDMRTGFVENWNLDEAKEDLAAGILSSAEMGIVSQEYAMNDRTPSITVDSTTLAIENPEGYYTWVPSDEIIESVAWFVSDQKNRDAVSEYLSRGTIPDTDDSGRSVRSHVTTINNAISLAKILENIQVFAGIGGDELIQSDDVSYYPDPGFTYGSLDPSVALADAIKNGRDSEGYANLLVIQAERGDSVFSANNDDMRMLFPRNTVWYVTREVVTDSLALDLPFTPANADQYSKVRVLYVEEMPEWYQERIGLIEPQSQY